MIHDVIENFYLYFDRRSWQSIYDMLRRLTPNHAESERITIIGDDIYAAVMTYATCAPNEAELETHDNYIDIQLSLVNGEAIDWFPRNALKEKIPYDPERDRTFYSHPAMAPVHIKNYPGHFSVFFPNDAHMPKLMVAEKSEMVKKAVIKVKKALFLRNQYNV